MAHARFATPERTSEIRQALADAPWVVLDTEFHPERRYLPQLYLVQIALPGGAAWLFDPLTPEPLLECADALCARPWVVHSGFHDLRLMRMAIGRVSEQVYDTQIAAGLVDVPYPAPLGQIVECWTGRHLPKGATLSDWSRRPLSAEQLDYAVDDVVGLLPLWERLITEIDALGRRQALDAACAEARKNALYPDDSELWRELPGAPTLNFRSAAIAQALVAWREGVARMEDQPARSLFPDGVMLEFSRRPPESVDAIAKDRRVSRSLAKRIGEELLAAIRQGKALADEQCPAAVPRFTPESRAAAWYEALLEVTGAAEHFGSRLVLPRARLDALVARPPATREELAERLGWRDELIGDTWWQASRGELALSLVDGVPQTVRRAR